MSDQDGLDDDLHRLVTWCADHRLLINKSKCAECLLYPKNTSPNSRYPSSTVKHYLESKRSSILAFISTPTGPGPLTLILFLTIFIFLLLLFYSKAPFNERPQIPLIVNSFRLCYPHYTVLLTHFPWTA